MLAELDEAGNQAKTYTLGNEYAGHVSELNNSLTSENKAASYYITDEQGCIRYILDQSGEVQNYYQYSAFGETIISEETTPNRLRYNAQTEDELTGRYYLRARYYAPNIGRFTQEDVIYNDGLNLYAYCGSNPVMYSDPSGFVKETCKSKVGGECGSESGTDSKFTNGSDVVPKYSTLEQRYAVSPSENGTIGYWTGKRGESMYVSSDPRVKSILDAHNQKGVNYKNGMPDFSPFVKHEFKIDMSNDRNKNFIQANRQLAEILSVETGQKWTSKKVTNWMSENHYTWHELNDCKTIQMVPSSINHPVFKHLGGVGEINIGLEGR